MDYEKLSIEFDKLLKKVTKEDFENWSIMDNLKTTKMKKKDNRVIPWQIEVFAISNITSHPSNHSSNEACSSFIRRERKKFAYKIMDLFEQIKNETPLV
jgi:hypothetical protein